MGVNLTTDDLRLAAEIGAEDTNEPIDNPTMGLSQVAIQNAINWTVDHPQRWPGYNVPLPKTPHTGGDLHIGARVRSQNGNHYYVVQFSADGEWAVIVPVESPQCAYVARLDDVRVSS